MKHWIIATLLFCLTGQLWAKTTCGERELARMDCRLTEQSFDLRLLAKTIAWSDGTWHLVDEMPLKGDAVEWEKATLSVLGGWPILQLWLWDKGEGELHVQSLHWFVITAGDERKLTLLADGVVRKRRAKEGEPSGKNKKLPKFIYDGWEKFGLDLLKSGDLEWHLADLKKTFAKKQVGHGI